MGNDSRKRAAKGRNSFQLYFDSLDVFDDLTDEEAGSLFRTIRKYAIFLRGKGDEPEEPKERLLKIAYIPIRNYLKRDYESYEEACKSKNPNGSGATSSDDTDEVYEDSG